MTLNEAIKIARIEVKNEYATAYLEAIEKSIEYGVEGLKTQLLYALVNMQNWRGEKAREVKKVFNEYIKKG